MGSSLVAYVPPSSEVECNSSPVFDSFPPLALCLGTDVEVIQSATDIDGDDLVYSFVAPYHGSSDVDPTETYAPLMLKFFGRKAILIFTLWILILSLILIQKLG